MDKTGRNKIKDKPSESANIKPLFTYSFDPTKHFYPRIIQIRRFRKRSQSKTTAIT